MSGAHGSSVDATAVGQRLGVAPAMVGPSWIGDTLGDG